MLLSNSKGVVYSSSQLSLIRDHPLVMGMQMCLVVGGAELWDLVQNRRATTANPVLSTGPYGPIGSNWEWGIAQSSDLNWTSGGFSVASLFRVPGTINPSGIMYRDVYTSSSVNAGWGIGINLFNAKYGFVTSNNNNTNRVLESTTSTSNGDHFLAATSDATTRRIYFEGTQEATSASNPLPASQTLRGLYSDSLSPLYIGYVWNRELSAGDIRQLSNNPFCVVQRSASRKFFIPYTPAQTVTGSSGIVSAEAFGSDGFIAGPVTGSAGIVSAETFGSGGTITNINTLIGATGIISAEAFGSGGVVSGPIIGTSGIVSAEAFGVGGLVQIAIIGLVGIPSAEAFGMGGVVTRRNRRPPYGNGHECQPYGIKYPCCS